MFKKDELEEEIKALEHEIIDLDCKVVLLHKETLTYRRVNERKNILIKLKHKLEQLLTSMTSDNSI